MQVMQPPPPTFLDPPESMSHNTHTQLKKKKKARLTTAEERLVEARGSGKNGRDWLVKEISRVGEEASALQAGARGRQQALFEAHRQVRHHTTRKYSSIRMYEI